MSPPCMERLQKEHCICQVTRLSHVCSSASFMLSCFFEGNICIFHVCSFMLSCFPFSRPSSDFFSHTLLLLSLLALKPNPVQLGLNFNICFTFISHSFHKKVIQSARCSLLNWRSTLTAPKCQAIFTTKCWYFSQLVFLIITTGITHPRHIACLHGLLEPPACLSIFFPVIWGKIW